MKRGDKIVVRDRKVNRWYEAVVIEVPPRPFNYDRNRQSSKPIPVNWIARIRLSTGKEIYLERKLPTRPNYVPRYVRTRAKR